MSDQVPASYTDSWAQCKLDADRVNEVDSVVALILENKARYQLVSKVIGLPWYWIGPVHYRESSLAFDRAFHNGDKIIGTGGLTTNVPKGRGPFDTWEDSVVDALELKGLNRINDWSVEQCLFQWELYNGLGYWGRENSPYVWAGTNLSDEVGKFVRDGVYDPDAVEKQLGTAALLLGLMEHDEGVARSIAGLPPVEAPKPSLGAYTSEELIEELQIREGVKTSITITLPDN